MRPYCVRRSAVLLILSVAAAFGQLATGHWKTNLSKKSIELSELRSGGPPKDGIPALRDPKFVAPSQAAAWLGQQEPVIVVEHAGKVRAYPLQILMWHELVNDRMGDLPLLVSFCPLCNTAIVFDRRIRGEAHDFGVSGMLRESDMVMFDRQTDSLWQQATGEAIVGAYTGERLTIYPSQTVSFETFAASFPEGLVMSRNTGHNRPYGKNPYAGYDSRAGFMAPVSMPRPLRAPKERIVTVSAGGRTKAYPFSYVRRKGVVAGTLGGTRYVVFHQPGTVSVLDKAKIAESRDVGSVGVFSPELDGRRLSFRRRKGMIVDKETASRWNVLGIATEGPLRGKRLTPLDHGVYFAFAYLVFNPDAEIVGVTGLEN